MKKIGIITLYRDNFGSILQAYSTYSYITSLGNDCTILQMKRSKNLVDKMKIAPFVLYKFMRYKGYYADRKRLNETSKKDINLLSSNTRELMDKFVNGVFKIETCSINDLKKINSKYDFFITGSDQVWNGYDEFKYLVFADKEKKIALAPSFGTKVVKDYFKKDIAVALNDYKVLSSREESGVKIIKELTGKNVVRLPDPTIIFNKKEWIKFAESGIKEENYILVHFLNTPNKIAIETINKYLEKNQCNVYCICNKYSEYKKLKRYRFIDINPYDYVSLIRYAKFIFTDSYHSTLFSLNLEKQFLTFERQYLHGNPQSSRIEDLLKRVGMFNRFISKNKMNIDFEKLEKWDSNLLFGGERDHIKKYIMESLKEEDSSK